MNGALLPCLFGAADSAEVLRHLHNPMAMRDVVARLSEDTDLGESLWKHDASCATMLSFQQALVAELPAWLLKCETSAGYKETLALIDDLVDEWRSRGVSPMKRQIRLRWMGFEVPLVVLDMSFEAQLRLHSAIKGQSLGQTGGLDMLLHETWLGKAVTGECKYPACAFKGMNEARKLASSMLASERIKSLEDVRDSLIGGQESLLSLDPFFLLEIEFAKTALTDGVATCVQDTILSLMPNIKSPATTLAVVIEEIEKFKQSKLGSLCSNSSKGEIDTTLGLLRKMSRGLPPPTSLQQSTDFYKHIHQSLQYFLREDVRGENGEEKTIFGKPVIASRLFAIKQEVAKAKAAPQAKQCLADLEALHPFRYLMSADETHSHAELVKELVGKGAKQARKERTKQEVVTKKIEKKKDDEPTAISHGGSVMSFFG